MRKFINTMLLLAAAFMAGAMTLSVIQLASDTAQSRIDGKFGGEVLILPLMILLIYIGYLIAKYYFINIVADRVYRKGYKKGIEDTNKQ